MKINIQFSGRRYHLGDDFPSALTLDPSSTVTDAVNQLQSTLTESQRLAETCLVILDGKHLGTVAAHVSEPLQDGAELLLLAPVAGG